MKPLSMTVSNAILALASADQSSCVYMCIHIHVHVSYLAYTVYIMCTFRRYMYMCVPVLVVVVA